MEDADDGPLPSPASGLFLEVSFRRLLASCEDIVAGTSIARPDLIGTWRRSPVFHHVRRRRRAGGRVVRATRPAAFAPCLSTDSSISPSMLQYVETLQEQLADLEASGGRVPRALLSRYAGHVDSLAAHLQRPDVPAFCAGVGGQLGAMPPVYGQQQHQAVQQQQQQLGGALPGARTPPLAPVPRPAKVPPVSVARTPQMPQPAPPQAQQQPAGFGGGMPPSPPPRRVQPPAGEQTSRLQTQQQLHVSWGGWDHAEALVSRSRRNSLPSCCDVLQAPQAVRPHSHSFHCASALAL